MGFNSAFKGLIYYTQFYSQLIAHLGFTLPICFDYKRSHLQGETSVE